MDDLLQRDTESPPGNESERRSIYLLVPRGAAPAVCTRRPSVTYGVNPTFFKFEYLFTGDVDTTVELYSVGCLISACIHDKRILGVWGESELANEASATDYHRDAEDGSTSTSYSTTSPRLSRVSSDLLLVYPPKTLSMMDNHLLLATSRPPLSLISQRIGCCSLYSVLEKTGSKQAPATAARDPSPGAVEVFPYRHHQANHHSSYSRPYSYSIPTLSGGRLQKNELLDNESNHSIGSWVPHGQFHKEPYAASALYHCRNTPLSMSQMWPMSNAGMLYEPMPSRSATNLLDMPIRTPDDMDLISGAPMDAELCVPEILRNADLNSVTKQEIRRQLEERFGMDLSPRKAMVNVGLTGCC